MVRKWIPLVAVLGAAAASSALADGRGRGHDYVNARVVAVEPIVRYVTVQRPRERCWDEVVYTTDRSVSVAGPAIAGGLIGGAIGRQLGGGGSRDTLTLAGAIAGSAIASERAARNRVSTGSVRRSTVQRCEVVAERFTEQRIEGYRVTYKHRGRHHTIVTPERPGKHVRLRVSAVPVGYRR